MMGGKPEPRKEDRDFDDTLRRLLKTPPQPKRKEEKKKPAK